jgi:hypothetical protein
MDKDDKINMNEIFENAMRDPSLFSAMDIETLLESIENENNDYLENKTTQTVIQENYQAISRICSDENKKKEICDKLIGYRFVDEINELFMGRHVRWIRLNNDVKLTNGGIVVETKFLDSGIHVLCKNNQHRFIQYKFDECYTFQKLSVEEQLILMAYDRVQKKV